MPRLGGAEMGIRDRMQAVGKSGQEDIFKETNKVFDVGRGAIEMEVNKAWVTFRSVFTMSFLLGCSQ
jgi:hypothetical protein